MSLSPIDQAKARRRAYHLFSELYLKGITADLLPVLQSIPELTDTLPDPFDPDESAAIHQDLFGFNIFPFASIFLHPSRLLGGPIADQHSDLYRQTSFTADSAVDPDHISQSLAFLAYLSEIEANYLASGQPPTIPRSQQYTFLDNHLLPWLIPFTIAIRLQDHPFYTQLAQLTISLVADHYASPEITNYIAFNQQAAPSNPPIAIDHDTTLRDIARSLVTPIQSGIYLGRNDINHLGRQLNLPHGFGRRDQMLQTLLQSAGQYDSAPQLFTALENLLNDWHERYQQITLDHPNIAKHIFPWQSRLQQTHQLLAQMQEESEQMSK